MIAIRFWIFYGNRGDLCFFEYKTFTCSWHCSFRVHALGCTPSSQPQMQYLIRQQLVEANKRKMETCKRPLKSASTTKRVAILMIGESFRSTRRQLSRRTCSPDSIPPQMQVAYDIKAKVVLPLKLANYTVDLFGTTYPCSNSSDSEAYHKVLHQMFDFTAFNGHLIKSKLEFGGQMGIIQASTKLALENEKLGDAGNGYDYFMFLRWDLRMVGLAMDYRHLDCAFDATHSVHIARDYLQFARNLGPQHANLDWMWVVPSYSIECLYTIGLNDPELCCESKCGGSACHGCMKNLNDATHSSWPGHTSSWMDHAHSTCPAMLTLDKAMPSLSETTEGSKKQTVFCSDEGVLMVKDSETGMVQPASLTDGVYYPPIDF